MIRLAYVCADPGIPVFGAKGCSIHVQEFLRALDPDEITTTLIAERIEHPRPIDLARVRVVHGPITTSREPANREKEALEGNDVFSALLRVHAPFDVVYERYSLWSYAGMEFARRMGIPGILEVNAPLIEEHALHRNLVDRHTAQSVFRRALEDATSIVTVSEAVAEYVNRFDEAQGKISVHPNGVDDRRFDPDKLAGLSDPDSFTIGFVGSLKPWHGLETLADAFALLHNNVPNARLLIVGDGPVRSELSDRLDRLGVINHSRFAGKVSPSEVPRLLASMDVAVAPNLPPTETGDYFSPLKLFEYMAMRLAVVCSRSGQMAHIIRDRENGLLFTPGSARELAEKLTELSKDRRLRLKLGKSARESVELNHTWRIIVRDILQTAGIPPARTGVA